MEPQRREPADGTGIAAELLPASSSIHTAPSTAIMATHSSLGDSSETTSLAFASFYYKET